MFFCMIIKVAFKSLLANKLRSVLSVLGVIVGVAAVIAMLAIVSGFHNWAMNRIKSFGANQLVVEPGGRGSGGVISGTQQNLTVQDALALCDVPHVEAVSPLVEAGVQAKYRNRNTATDALGVAPTFLMIANYQIDRGVMFSDDDVDRNAHVAVLAKTTVDQLFGKTNPIGKLFKVQGLNFRVVGTVKNRGGGEGYSENEIFVPHTTAMHALLGTPSLNEIFVEAEDGSDLLAVEHDLVEVPRGHFRYVLHIVALFGIGIAERNELPIAPFTRFKAGHIAACRVGNAARHLHAVTDEEGLHCFKQSIVGKRPAAISLDINLVDLDLRAQRFPRTSEICRIIHALHDTDRNINSYAELIVRRSLSNSHGVARANQQNSKQYANADRHV